MTVSDGRDQTRPGWTVSGQVGDFTNGTRTFSGADLGWAPAIAAPNAGHDVVAGPVVAPGTDPGLRAGGGRPSRARAGAWVPPRSAPTCT
ncbi:hypothetical protein [Dactylosporangium sp. NPDC049140]|uniref:hypothetical protein n=1 Tax=Dactylosporangium sp. NPDC049140 TaxID=3155647 RepID=UPI0033E1B1AE